jgi:hypothetical protein
LVNDNFKWTGTWSWRVRLIVWTKKTPCGNVYKPVNHRFQVRLIKEQKAYFFLTVHMCALLSTVYLYDVSYTKLNYRPKYTFVINIYCTLNLKVYFRT